MDYSGRFEPMTFWTFDKCWTIWAKCSWKNLLGRLQPRHPCPKPSSSNARKPEPRLPALAGPGRRSWRTRRPPDCRCRRSWPEGSLVLHVKKPCPRNMLIEAHHHPTEPGRGRHTLIISTYIFISVMTLEWIGLLIFAINNTCCNWTCDLSIERYLNKP